MPEIWSDLNEYSPTKVAKVTDVASVYQSIGNILATHKLTRMFEPEFGSEIWNVLWEPMDDISRAKLYDAVVSAIQRWEVRVFLVQSESFVLAFPDEHRYEASLVFTIIGLDKIQYRYIGTFFTNVDRVVPR
jgi:phage baseplate assembly protein W